jgi:hypothetical protein
VKKLILLGLLFDVLSVCCYFFSISGDFVKAEVSCKFIRILTKRSLTSNVMSLCFLFYLRFIRSLAGLVELDRI